MTIREFGTENDRTLLFFQGSCEPWQEFCPAAQGLAALKPELPEAELTRAMGRK